MTAPERVRRFDIETGRWRWWLPAVGQWAPEHRIPVLPVCGRAAAHRIEVYTLAGGYAHGSLDATVYTCGKHRGPVRAAVNSAKFTPHTVGEAEVDGWRCGDGYDFIAGRPLVAPEIVVADAAAALRAFAGPDVFREDAWTLLHWWVRRGELSETQTAAVLAMFEPAGGVR